MTQQIPPPETSQFDFWLGTWDATWGDNGCGHNRIQRAFDGFVIHEQFESFDESPLHGMSVSVYNPRFERWHQTWVDNQGSYLDFVGGWQDDRMILTRRIVYNNKPIQQRMIWYNITSDAFDWQYERSDDDGATWSVTWQILYTRSMT